MSLNSFADVLDAARQQTEPQRLLLVFAGAELPRDASELEQAAFERGEGGALEPRVCVDKLAAEIEGFPALMEESRQTGVDWDILLVAALSGRGGFPPSADEAAQPLRMMVQAVKVGRVGDFLAVDRSGQLVQLQAR